mgnify:CR=1 FL=1
MIHLKPQAITDCLQTGDIVNAIAISSTVTDDEHLLSGLSVFEEWGLVCNNQVVKGRSWGYLAGEDSERHNQLHSKANIDLLAFCHL